MMLMTLMMKMIMLVEMMKMKTSKENDYEYGDDNN